MLDITYIRENADLVRQAVRNKQLDPSVVDAVLESDAKRRELQTTVDGLRQAANQNAESIKQAVAAGGRPSPDLVDNGKRIKDELKILEPQLTDAVEAFTQAMLQVPNVPAEDVPVGTDESGNQVVKQVGEKRAFDFAPKPHHELMEQLDWLDTQRAVRIGGFRSYFLKGDGVRWEQALMRLAMKILGEAGFVPMSTPVLVNEDMMWGTGYFPWGSEDHYKTQDGQYLAGTSEVALTAYHAGETLTEADLPIKMAGISPCFRREVGSYGKDMKGVIRVHQFTKVEQVVYTVADEAVTREWHQQMVGFSERLLTELGLPYQVLLMCTGDMGGGQRKKYDLETWFPSQEKYRETHSASYFNDFQSRRLNIRYKAADGSLKYVYTLNNTMAASPRLLAAIVENYQQKDGTIALPAALKEWL